jgi:hypothetical protein
MKVKKTIVRLDNSINVTYVLKIYQNNTYEFTTLVKRSGCHIVASRKKGTCVNN